MGNSIQTSHGIFEEVDAGVLSQDQRLASAANTGPGFQRSAQSQINKETIEAIAGTQSAFQEQFQRDQGYVGNNAQNVGYILEDQAKYITSRMTPLNDMTPRVAMPGIDKINYRTVLDLFGGNGPGIGSGVMDQGGTAPKVNYAWKDLAYTAKMEAISDIVTFETEIYGRSFQGDPLALASAKLIPALKQIQEFNYINWGVKCWSPAPSNGISTVTTGGLLSGWHLLDYCDRRQRPGRNIGLWRNAGQPCGRLDSDHRRHLANLVQHLHRTRGGFVSRLRRHWRNAACQFCHVAAIGCYPVRLRISLEPAHDRRAAGLFHRHHGSRCG